MKTSFEHILNNYLTLDKMVDSSTDTYAQLCRTIPFELREYIDNSIYKTKGSMGQGNRTDYPWISILDQRITNTTQKGLYVVYLFKKDMSGFYLTINQGITNFENLYKREKYKKAKKVTDYFKDQIDDTTFSKQPISLGSEYGDLGYGYETTTILQKYYPKGQFSEKMLVEDFKEIMEIYKHNSGWKLNTVGQGYRDGLKRLCASYGLIVS